MEMVACGVVCRTSSDVRIAAMWSEGESVVVQRLSVRLVAQVWTHTMISLFPALPKEDVIVV